MATLQVLEGVRNVLLALEATTVMGLAFQLLVVSVTLVSFAENELILQLHQMDLQVVCVHVEDTVQKALQSKATVLQEHMVILLATRHLRIVQHVILDFTVLVTTTQHLQVNAVLVITAVVELKPQHSTSLQLVSSL
jgi:hypothetical protein